MSRTRPRIDSLEDRVTPATLIGLTTTDHLITLDSASPNAIARMVKIKGVGGENVVSIDARPANGVIYALTSTNKLYTVSSFTGRATRVGTDPVGLGLGPGRAGLDFNPTVDRLRVTTTGDRNFRYNPATGAIVDGDAGQPGTQPDTPLAYAAGDANFGDNPVVVDVAYDRNFQGAPLTTLFGIDATQNALVSIGGVDGTPSPNAGALSTIGFLTANPGARLGFDIAVDGTAYAVFRAGNGAGPLRLFTIDLGTGATTGVGVIGTGTLELDGLTTLPREEIIYAVTVNNRLISFRADEPGRILSTVTLQGLIVGENVTEIDFRPASGELFAFTSLGRILRIDTANGQTTQLGAPISAALYNAGVAGGFDFNPNVDRVRLSNTDDDNLRFDPTTFAPVDSDANPGNGTTPDANLAFDPGDVNAGADPNIVGLAYDRNDNDDIAPPNTGTATTLFGIDSGLDTLVTIGGTDGTPSPNLGGVFTIGSLGTLVTDLVGFDIIDQGTAGVGAALSVMQVEGETTSKLFSINLNASTANQPRGAATLVGEVGGGELIRAMAIAPPRIQFKKTGFTVNEAAGTATITITRTGGSGSAASALFSALGGTATPTGDYLPPAFNTPIAFARGVTAVTITISVVNDAEAEALETVLLSLAAATGGNTLLGVNSTATLTIVSNE